MAQQESIRIRLSQRFGATPALLHAPQATRDTWIEEFLKRYTEPQRHYHDLTHIDAMLACYDQASIDDEVVVLAIIFHDWIYDPQAKDNELESARVFDRFADQLELPIETRQAVRRMIKATISHTLPNEHVDERLKLFLDFDLEALSRPGRAYAIYSQQIRKEYIHFEDEAYRKGREGVLENFLKRERIYFSEPYAPREHVARENIRAEIEGLRSL